MRDGVGDMTGFSSSLDDHHQLVSMDYHCYGPGHIHPAPPC